LIKNSAIAEISAQTICLCAVEQELTFVKDSPLQFATNLDNRDRTVRLGRSRQVDKSGDAHENKPIGSIR
jgi:hypothetical protein